MSAPNRISIREVAQAAGVAPSTVSLALRNRGRVSPETRERIEIIARDLGYQPDLLYSIVAGRRSRKQAKETVTIGLIVERETPNERPSKQALQDAIQSFGCHAEVCRIDPNESIARAISSLRNRGCGAVLLRASGDPRNLNPSLFDGIAVLCIDEPVQFNPWPFDTIKRAHFADVRNAWNRLRECGYQRIGAALYCHDPVISDDSERIGAVLSAQHLENDTNSCIPPLTTRHGDDMTNNFYRWVEANKPDAVIAFNVAPLWHLHDMGYRIPQEMGFVTLHTTHEIERIKGSTYRLSGYKWDNTFISETSVQIVINMMRREEFGIPRRRRIHHVCALWEEGATISRRPPSHRPQGSPVR